MQEQHKDMLRELKTGNFDSYIGLKPAAAAPAAAAPAAPPPPVPDQAAEFKEKPAAKTINLSEDAELKDEDIFGADIISDKSLDDVILSFLAKQIDEDGE